MDMRNIDELFHIWAQTRDQTCNLGMCLDQESNPQHFCVGLIPTQNRVCWFPHRTTLQPTEQPSQDTFVSCCFFFSFYSKCHFAFLCCLTPASGCHLCDLLLLPISSRGEHLHTSNVLGFMSGDHVFAAATQGLPTDSWALVAKVVCIFGPWDCNNRKVSFCLEYYY